MQVLIGQYHELAPGDTVMWGEPRLPGHAQRDFTGWRVWGARCQHGGTAAAASTLTANSCWRCYAEAIGSTPGLKLMLLSQVYPCNGRVRRRCATLSHWRARMVSTCWSTVRMHWARSDVNVAAMDVDFAGFNLHKWIGVPLGLGFVLHRKDSAAQESSRTSATAITPPTISAAGCTPACRRSGAILAAPTALDFHEPRPAAPSAKGARLQWLLPLLGPAVWPTWQACTPLSPMEAEDATSLAAFSVRRHGRARRCRKELLAALRHLYRGAPGRRQVDFVRATVAPTTRTSELDRLVAALAVLGAEAG